MGLKVSVHHPLGERSLHLEMRSDGRPLMVGRAPHVDVVIPSTVVGRNHCAIYARDGHWMIVDSGSGRGTYVNGMEVVEAIPLKVGDLIVLGKGGDVKPPTIRILEHTPSIDAAAPPVDGMADDSTSDDAAAPPDEGYADTLPPPEVVVEDVDGAEAAADDFVDLGLRTSPRSKTRVGRSRHSKPHVVKTRMGPAGWTLSIILGAVIVAGLIWGIQRLKHRLDNAGGVKVIIVNEPATQPVEKPKGSIFTHP